MTRNILILLIVLLFVLVISLNIFALVNRQFDAVATVSAASTFVIALLTGAYVLINTEQLKEMKLGRELMMRQLDEMRGNNSVMLNQLEEMRLGRELQGQPLPWVHKVKIVAEKPSFYGSPNIETKSFDYHAISRYFVYFDLENVGDHPALSLDILACISIRGNEDLECAAIRIDALAANAEWPGETDEKESFLIAGDESAALLMSLMENDVRKYPSLSLKAVYRNILGANFLLSNEYRIYPTEFVKDELLKNWVSQIATCKIKYKREIEQLKRTGVNSADRTRLFDEVRTDFLSDIIGDDVELRAWPIPGRFKVKPISNDEHEKIIENIGYPLLMTAVSQSDRTTAKHAGEPE